MEKIKKLCTVSGILFGIPVIYILARVLEINEKAKIIQALMFAATVVIVGVYVICSLKNKDNKEKYSVYALMAVGIVLRAGYMLYTGCRLRSHDIGNISMNGNGHATYILTLIHTGNLPFSNKGQMYQQPLYYYLAALFSKTVNGILSSAKDYYYVDAAKTVSCIASCINLLAVAGFTKKFGNRTRNIMMAVLAFTPACIISSGTVNADSLTMLFMTLCFFMTLKWYETPCTKNILILALCYGFGVMTKISLGVMAVFTVIYFIKMFKEVLTKENISVAGAGIKKYNGSLKKLFTDMCIFAVVSLPLGLWYSYRNYSLFGQGFGYVLEQSQNSQIYMGDKSYFARLLPVDIKSLLFEIYPDVRQNYNLPVYLLKSSLFGEFSYNVSKVLPFIMTVCGIVLAIYLIVSIIKCNNLRKDYVFVLLLILLFENYFYIRYPFSCSMDFRYIIFVCIPAGILLGDCRNKKMTTKTTCRIFDVTCILFCIMSSLFFMII